MRQSCISEPGSSGARVAAERGGGPVLRRRGALPQGRVGVRQQRRAGGWAEEGDGEERALPCQAKWGPAQSVGGAAHAVQAAGVCV